MARRAFRTVSRPCPSWPVGLGHHEERVLRAALPATSGRPELLPLALLLSSHRHGLWGWRLLRRLLGPAPADETARREELPGLLWDPHPGVVDQVLRWLLPHAEDLPEARIAALLAPADPRHVRRTGVWLAEWYDRQGWIRLLAPYAGDPDPWIRGRARRAARG